MTLREGTNWSSDPPRAPPASLSLCIEIKYNLDPQAFTLAGFAGVKSLPSAGHPSPLYSFFLLEVQYKFLVFFSWNGLNSLKIGDAKSVKHERNLPFKKKEKKRIKHGGPAGHEEASHH